MIHGAPTVFPSDIGLLMHALGIDGRAREQWGYRNYFATDPKGADHDGLKRLQAAGLARLSGFDGTNLYYKATREGCFLAGMEPHEVDRMGGKV